jgi:HK97 family phage major capsid protein
MLQAGCLVSAVRTDASEIDALDLARMWSARYPGVSDYVWLVNSSIYPQLFNLSVGQMPVYLPAGGLSASPYGSIFGRPVVETEYNPYLGTLGDIMLVSPSQYAMIAKGGVQSASSIHVNFVYDETAFRFVYRVDGQPLWASAITAYDGTSSLSPFVALAAST